MYRGAGPGLGDDAVASPWLVRCAPSIAGLMDLWGVVDRLHLSVTAALPLALALA